MSIQKYYPPLSELIDTKALPGDFEALENILNEGIDLILGKIFYKDFSVQIINSGDTKFYSIKLLTKTIRLPLVADMNLVFLEMQQEIYQNSQFFLIGLGQFLNTYRILKRKVFLMHLKHF